MKKPVTHRIADILGNPDKHDWNYIDGPLDEAFVGIRDDGKVVICWQGEYYTKMWIPPRARIYNWLNHIGTRKLERRERR